MAPTRRGQLPSAALMVMRVRLAFRLLPRLPRAHSISTCTWLLVPENLLPWSAWPGFSVDYSGMTPGKRVLRR